MKLLWTRGIEGRRRGWGWGRGGELDQNPEKKGGGGWGGGGGDRGNWQSTRKLYFTRIVV